MKIIFVVPYAYLNGGIRVIAIYAEYLQNRGHEVLTVFPAAPGRRLKDKIKTIIKGKGWLAEPRPCYFSTINVPYHMLDTDRSVTDADLPDADVVIATWWETAEWVARLSPRKGAKVYFIQHHETHDYLPVDRVAATYRSPLHKIVVADWIAKIMATQYEDRQVSIVPNSIDTQQFYAPPRSKQVIPTVGMVYSSTFWKGSDISFEAFRQAKQQCQNLHLIAFGFRQPLPNLPLPEEADYFCNPLQTELKNLYAQCDAWLFSSRSEGFGLPILEAMACRTPVIGTPSGAAPELLSSGGGILVKVEDPQAMAEAILQICQLSEQQWQVMSATAYHQATSYTWKDATERFETALKTAVERWQRNDF